MEHKKIKNTDWKGYTLEELRYQRALNEVAIEMEKYQLQLMLLERMDAPVTEDRQWRGSFVSKFMRSLSFLDYAILGVKLVGIGKKIKRFWRKK